MPWFTLFWERIQGSSPRYISISVGNLGEINAPRYFTPTALVEQRRKNSTTQPCHTMPLCQFWGLQILGRKFRCQVPSLVLQNVNGFFAGHKDGHLGDSPLRLSTQPLLDVPKLSKIFAAAPLHTFMVSLSNQCAVSTHPLICSQNRSNFLLASHAVTWMLLVPWKPFFRGTTRLLSFWSRHWCHFATGYSYIICGVTLSGSLHSPRLVLILSCLSIWGSVSANQLFGCASTILYLSG